MRLAEGTTIPDRSRDSGGWCVTVLSSVARRRIAVVLAGSLAGGLFAGTSALAQDAGSLSREIKERIESTFALVLGNTADLAIPLTRRALARRSIEDDRNASVDALAYRDPSAVDAPERTATVDPAPAAPPVKARTAEDEEDDPTIARLPRPRPLAPDEEPQAEAAAGEEAMGGPLDLVAGAAVEEAPVVVASADPQPLLAAHPSSDAAANADPGASVELVASGTCLSPDDVTDKDGDFERNREVLSGNAFCIAEETFKERRRAWTIATVRTSRPGPLWAIMHDDEDMSFDNAVAALQTYGGTLVAVETGGRRNMDGIDPNRNFSADGVGCKKMGDDATPEYTAFFRKLFDPVRPIIALHNNTGERVSTGGLGHVSMPDIPKDMEAHESTDPDGPLAGERALVLLTSPVPVTTTAAARAADLAAKGINAVIEGVQEGKGDCSLSNYALLTGHADYLNVTVDHDERDKQKKIIDVIMRGTAEEVATQ